jgi:hypothetical protein
MSKTSSSKVCTPVLRLASSFACHGRPVEADVLMLCCAWTLTLLECQRDARAQWVPESHPEETRLLACSIARVLGRHVNRTADIVRMETDHQDQQQEANSEHQNEIEIEQLLVQKRQLLLELHETRQQLQHVEGEFLLATPREEAERNDERMHVYGCLLYSHSWP